MTYTLQLAIFSPPNSLFIFILTLWARHKLCARCSFGSCHIVNAGFTRLRIRGIVLEIIVYSFNLSKLHSLGRNASLFMGFVLACYWRFFWLKWNQRSLRSEILFCLLHYWDINLLNTQWFFKYDVPPVLISAWTELFSTLCDTGIILVNSLLFFLPCFLIALSQSYAHKW